MHERGLWDLIVTRAVTGCLKALAAEVTSGHFSVAGVMSWGASLKC